MKHVQPATASGNPKIEIAEYVCGLLKSNEHAEVHLLLSRDDQALAQALAWEADLLALVDALPQVRPEPALRERLQRTLGIGPPPALQPPPQPQLLRQLSRDPDSSPPPSSEPENPAQAHEPSTTSTQLPPEQESAPSLSAPQFLDGHHQAVGLLSNEGLDARDAAQKERPQEHHISASEADAFPRHSAPIPEEDDSRPARQAPIGAPGISQLNTAASTRRTEHAPGPTPPNETAMTRTAQPGLQRKLWLWRLIGICASAAAVVGFMRPTDPPPAPVNIVKVAPTRAAILQAPGTSSTPGWTATLGPEGDLMMQPLVNTEVPVGSQVLLWTRSARLPEARLLGRIDPNQPVLVPAGQLGAMADDQLLEITLETDTDAAQGVPNGPILFIGQMAVFGSEGATTLSENNNASSNAAAAVTQ